MPKIVKTWDEMPPVVFDGAEAFSTRVLERNYREMQVALQKIYDAALPPISFDRERILKLCKDTLAMIGNGS